MLNLSLVDPILKSALREDMGGKDLTSSALIPKNLLFKAEIIAKEEGVLCGVLIAERIFRLVDQDIRFLPAAKDGDSLDVGREIAYVEGRGPSILAAERTALNFLSHLSGIATKTRAFCDQIKGTGAKILDTRKTTPNLRILEKYAVKVGGGVNHRFGLYDQVLIKDNHLMILRQEPIVKIVDRVKKSVLKKTIIGLEVKNLEELSGALKSKADYILLDNMNVETIRKAIQMRKDASVKIPFEVSGGVTLQTVRAYAETGVERISVGTLTRDVKGLDISLDIVG